MLAIDPSYLAVFGLGSTELFVVLGIVLLLFGGTKLPALAKGVGQSMREFRKAATDEPTDSVLTKAQPKRNVLDSGDK